MLQLSVNRDYATDIVHAIVFSPAERLRRWLAGRWSLLFSHPEDFAAHGFEADRWLSCLSEEFERLDLGVIGVGGNHHRTWVGQVGGRVVPVSDVDDLLPADWRVGAHEHFVTILDGALHARRTVVYVAGSQVPSPIELAQTAAGLRARSWPASSVCRVLQRA
jgi:hypothetical protein